VNLRWAVGRLQQRGRREPDATALWDEAAQIHAEDRAMCRGIGEQGLPLLANVRNVLTHCNAGAMAVSELGTATAPIYRAAAAGQRLHVWVDETRPLLQGARITAWELAAAGIPHTLICDNAAASVMAAGRVDCVIVGTDRITRNGDVVNKIGTLNLAVLCRHFRIPFYVACPSSTFDAHTPTGADVIIETRAAREVLGPLNTDTPVHNPAFDVTPAELVSAIITERGVIRGPFTEELAAALPPATL
jgi:methylthioribose-1-phosphate isomerase